MSLFSEISTQNLVTNSMRNFFQVYDFQNIIKNKPCFKNKYNPSCIDLVVTSRSKSFQYSTVLEARLSGFLKLSLAVMKIFYMMQRFSIIRYRNYHHFDKELLMTFKIAFRKNFVKTDFYNLNLLRLLADHAPLNTMSGLTKYHL